MRINTNISALNTHRLLSQSNDAVARSIGRLSSGFRINTAKDDAAGLAIANKFQADVRSLRVAQQNTTEATSMLQTAEGGASTISDILGRMKELATQAASYNSKSQTEAGTLNNEFEALAKEIDRIVGGATYQGTKLLDGSFSGTFQVGSTNAGDDKLDISLTSGAEGSALSFTNTDTSALGPVSWNKPALAGLADGAYSIKATVDGDGELTGFELTDGSNAIASGEVDADGKVVLKTDDPLALTLASFTIDISGFSNPANVDGVDYVADGLGVIDVDSSAVGAGGLSTTDLDLAGVDLGSSDNAQSALTAIDKAIDTVNSFLGKIGATQNRLDYAAANIATTIENYSASESAIRDADMAFEMTTFTRNQIMQQAATAMLAQANMAPQGVLRLLG